MLNHAHNFLEVLLQGAGLLKMPFLNGLDAWFHPKIFPYMRKDEVSLMDNCIDHDYIIFQLV